RSLEDGTGTHIILMRRTEQGIINFKDTIKRAEATRSEAERTGSKFTVYWTFGRYDGIGILEAPNDEAAMEFGLKVGSLGNIRTTTLKEQSPEKRLQESLISVAK
ncbi:MAG: GYD domain-containing protein, partial [Thermoproteota archaeon]|nr:GYD domain-containing protein [Thermoproteota archaeon]